MVETGFWHFLLGNLSWGALPFVRAWRDPNTSEIIGAGAGAMVVIGAVAMIALISAALPASSWPLRRSIIWCTTRCSWSRTSTTC